MKPPSLKVRLLVRLCALSLFNLSLHPFLTGFVRGAESRSDGEWQRTVEAAKKEGKVSVFLYQRENIEAAVRVFEKKFLDIQVVSASTPAAETGPRLMAERRAGKFLWDVCLCGPTTPLTVLYPAKALDPIKPALLLPEVTDVTKWWEDKHHYMDPEGSHIFVFVGSVDMPNLFYNKNLVDPNEFKSYWDMIKTKWRGKIVAVDPRQPGRPRVGARILYNIPDLGEKFLTRLFTEMDVVLSREDRQALDWLAVGKYALCLFCGNIEAATSQGLPVAEFEVYRWRETPAISSGSNGSIALMNQAPHPNAARVFINWLLSREGQASFQKVMNSADLLVESMRVDIAKDPVPALQRRVAGTKYIIMDTPERSNQEPVSKLLKEIIKK
ncbi:MAG TPA: substrate-binding domain-containing protein [Candidatus Binatia bacterium]|jgi:iron(III) transport system substrate-binding protein|nr:substrate-binding domain-containing protein [Candidatus Binatia bacterium]